MNTEATAKASRDRSPDYPAVSLRRAVELTGKLYGQDRQNWTTSATAVNHLGYSSLNGKSRTVLSALKKFGLIDYKGGDLKVSALAMRILVPTSQQERSEAILVALEQPKLYQWLLQHFPGWDLPSDETLRARLIRDRGFNPTAVKGLLADLRESLDFAFAGNAEPLGKDADARGGSAEGSDLQVESDKKHATAAVVAAPVGGHRLSLPGTEWYVWLPHEMNGAEAKRMNRWVEKVLIPQLEFLAEDLTQDARASE